jgi:NCS1 family nucleobase:cation symporter-1
VIRPWHLLADYGTYIFGWLVGYSSFLGPIAGIFIADYWLIRKSNLSLADLYQSDGIYGRWNWKALVSLIAGVTVALIGLVVPALRVLYDYAWFVGFGVAFVLYWGLMRGAPVVDLDGLPED